MPNVVIVGVGGAARECYWILDDMLKAAPGLKNYYLFKGFLNWNKHPQDLKRLASFLLGDGEKYSPCSDDVFVIGIAQPSVRKEIYEFFKAQDAAFMNLVHPWSDIASSAIIGEGNIFQRGSTVYCDTVVGNANYFNGSVNLSHDSCIGDFNFIGPTSLLLGESSIGSLNSFGSNVTVLPKARIGDANIIAPGSVIFKGCRNNCRMAGNPALCIGKVEPGYTAL